VGDHPLFPLHEVHVGQDVAGRELTLRAADVARYEAGTRARRRASRRRSSSTPRSTGASHGIWSLGSDGRRG